MRMFVKYDKKGSILSFCKTDSFPDTYETPFDPIEPGEFVIEVKLTPSLNKLECDEIHENYVVDVEKKELIKKSIGQ